MSLKKKEQKIIAPEYDDNYFLEDAALCSHHFYPLDSAKTYFACSKCGYVVKKDRLRRKNSKKKTV